MFLPLLLATGFSLLAAAPVSAAPTAPRSSAHPRLFLGPDEVPALRARAATPAFAPVLDAIRSMIKGGDPFGAGNRKTRGNEAALFLATGDRAFADRARDELLSDIAQTKIWANPSFKALSRASLARGGAMTYDLCHDAWVGQTVPASVVWNGTSYQLPADLVGKDLNATVSRALLESALALVKSGGKDWPGNGKPGNNWNGVRYGTALLALLACDEPADATRPAFETSLRILRQYLQAAYSTDPAARGWNPEGYGYTFYPAQFTYPAAIALARLRDIRLADETPAFRASFAALYHGLLALPQRHPGGYLGLHPDFTDDNADWIGEGVANLAFAFAPVDQLPALRWIYRRTFGELGDRSYDTASAGGLFALLYLDPAASGENPASQPSFGLNFSDPYHGFYSFRKAFGEPAGADVLAEFMTKTHLTQGGHAAPDGMGFRLWGLGVPWTCGSGRTTDPAGQCTIFSGEPEDAVSQSQVHRVLDSYLRPAGGGTLVAKAQPFSDTGVRDHTRRFLVDYRADTGAEAAFLVADTSSNGRIWRLNTPGLLADSTAYNTITHEGDMFTITNQSTGNRLVARVLCPAHPVFRTGTFKRGSPMSVPLGLGRDKGAEATENAWIDFRSDDGTFVVAFTLLRAGQPVPNIASTVADGTRTVKIGRASYSVSGDTVRVSGWERPLLEVAEPAPGQVFSGGEQSVSIVGRATWTGGPVASVSVSVNGCPAFPADLAGDAWRAKTPPLPPGRHEAFIRASDPAGETSEKTVSFRISRTRPPELHLASPEPGSTLPADKPVEFRGTVSDPDGPLPAAVELVGDDGKALATARPAADGSWNITLPPAGFVPGRHSFILRSADSVGDVGELPPLTLIASRRFSDGSPFGDLAAWTREREWRVSLEDDGGNLRYTIVPSEAYRLRRAMSFLADRTVTGDFRARFKIRLRTRSSVFQLRFGRDAFLTFGGSGAPASAPPGLGFSSPSGESVIGRWTRPLLPDLEWHIVEASRTGEKLEIQLDGHPYFSATLSAERTLSTSPADLVAWDKRNGPEGRQGGALSRFWGSGPFGFGCPFADQSHVQMDDFEFSEQTP
jgi:hypothetical protein